jgi:hypothetical protein
MISERYRRVDVVATRQEDHTWLARAGDLQLPFRYPTADDALREARAHVDGRGGMPKTTEKYIAVVHYEAGDPSATVFAIDETARQAIAAAKGEEPDDDFVSFPATSALAAQIAEGHRLYARLEDGQAYGEDEQTPNDLLNEPNL